MVKVLFLENTEHHELGEIKNVPDGYARNFLMPKGIAVMATEKEIEKWQSKINKMKTEEDKTIQKLTELAEKIEDHKFSVSAEAGEEDKLFGSITNSDLAEVLEKAGFNEIDKHKIEILDPIHSLGEHSAMVKLGHGIHANMNILVNRSK